jgi:hypothetical protein
MWDLWWTKNFGFPCQSIPPISSQSPSPIIRGWYNRQVAAAVPKVPPHKLKKNIRILLPCLLKSLTSLSLSLIFRPTVSRPVCLGIKHPSGAYDQIFITVRQLLVCWYEALSLTRGRVCRLQFPRPMELLTIFDYLRFDTSLFIASYYSQGDEWVSYITTDDQSVSLSRYQAFIWTLWPDFYYC